jgi:hypothetical protein
MEEIMHQRTHAVPGAPKKNNGLGIEVQRLIEKHKQVL